ncbi:MAG TPA: DNA polymerase III subunit gamma/tau [Bacteroidales bacterium]|nr:DNA polymerase III subunit gamma/tau [Bacteroidales bacterium]HPK30073.1 DNA polymerase III subunit gamma/tau [Bacteroidales bacterium]
MGQFIVSARKYRPNDFDSLIGQENIARTLKNSILRNQLAHAYLFCGPRGVGKTSAARIFAKTINCSNISEDLVPCGICESCLSFAEGRSYSIHELDAASNNSVDDIRNLTDKVRIPPQIGKYSVYIIDEVHMLSQQAFNAFLKTLEEPPSYAIFILATTEKHKILPTILSRCQTYDFNRISVDNIVRNLKDIAQKEHVTIGDDTLHIIAQKADGAMRDALTLFDQTVAFCGHEVSYEQVIRNLNVLDYEYYFKLTDEFLKGDYAAAFLIFDEILSKGFNALHFISGLSNHFRDLLVCKHDASQALLELAPSIAKRYRELSEKCSSDFLYEALATTTECEVSYRNSGNPRLLIEFALLRITRIGTAPSVAQPTATVQAAQPTVAKPAAVQATPTATRDPEPGTQNPQLQTTDSKLQTPKTSLSIKDVMKEVKSGSSSKQMEFAQEIVKVALNEENLKQVWEELVSSQSRSPNLSSALAKGDPQIDLSRSVVSFSVSNITQKEYIDRHFLKRLEAFLKERIDLPALRLEVTLNEVADQCSTSKLYMPSDKANYLQKTSEEYRELKKNLGLDTI